ncbi:Winged helix DNA-binding domain-containing protein [Clostridium cochlearium]|uniref:Winged helix DNA-binding domain-containing protein n=1 Tax=Clostridium cochlearium TaxID=1494 RepID=A0ABY0QMK5_CLOCO|nr:MarR family transcriptional regulator [Clostridium cochlearium]SDL27893.1 Winged helix DNA-binding domain-containing protein [Clostridium cochlearium]
MDDKKLFELLKDITNLSKLINRRLSAKLDVKKISPYPVIILNQLDISKPTTLTDIRERLGIPNSTISTVVDKLLEKELVIKEKDATDKRRTFLYLTEKACEEEKKIIKQHVEVFKEILCKATEDDLNTLIDATKLFIKLIEENDKGDEV